MKVTAIILAFSALVSNVSAQGADAASRYILEVAIHAKTSQELARSMFTMPAPRSETIFWTNALGISTTSRANEPTERANIARFMEAALIHAGVKPDSFPLYELSAEDITAMRTAVGFPDDGDLLIYLLHRGPSLLDDFEFETYTAMRLSLHDTSLRLIRERADRPYLGIGSQFGMRIVESENDPASKDPREYGKTRRFHLAALPEIILAAKAFRAAERAPSQHVVYPAPYCGAGIEARTLG